MGEKKVCTIVSSFIDIAEERKNDIAVVYKDELITYGELDELSNRIVNNLYDKGIKQGSVIAVFMAKNISFIATIIGILKAGCIYLPMDIIYPMERIKSMVEIAKVSAIIIGEVDVEQNFEKLSPTFLYQTLILENEKHEVIEVKPKDLAYIIFTSGSTGKPKGISIKHESVMNLVESLLDILNPELIRIGCVAPVVFDMSVAQIFYSLLTGRQLILIPDSIKIYPDQLLEYIVKHKIELCDFTPTHLQMVLNVIEVKKQVEYFPREIVAAGEALPVDLTKKILETVLKDSGRVVNLYGPAEACVYVSGYVIDYKLSKQITEMKIGKPLHNIKIYIVNDEGNICGKDEVGELCITGIAVADGYYNNEELTKQAFIKEPFGESIMYRTGDFARWDDKGELIYLGRKDSQVKIRGYRIELNEIEYHLSQVEGIKQARVIVKECNEKKVLVAYYVAEHDYPLSLIRDELSKVVPYYMIPDVCIRVEQFDTSVNGKLDVSKLPQFDMEMQEVVSSNKQNSLKEFLLKTCGRVLNREVSKITLEDNFFSIGGNSFNVIELYIEIYNWLGVSVDLVELYEQKTIAGIVQVIEKYINKNQQRKKMEIQTAPATWFHKTVLHNEVIETERKMTQTGIRFPSYNIVHKIKVNKYIDAEKFKQAIKKVISFYGAFHTTFRLDKNQYYLDANIENEDYEFFSYIKTEEKFSKENLRIYAKVFDVHKLPLFQVVFFEHEKEQVIMLNIHHGIFDYFSMKLFMTKIFQVYEGHNIYENYKDYASSVNEYLNSDRSQYLMYWKKYYRKRQLRAEFLSDIGTNKHKTKDNEVYSQIEKYIEREDVLKLRQLCSENGFSEYTFLITTFALLLGKYAQMNDVILGTYVPGRNANNGGVIGLFTQMVGIRFKFKDTMTFYELASMKQDELTEIMKNQYVEVYEVYQNLEFEDLVKGELFSIIYNYVTDISIDIDGTQINCNEIGDEPEHLPFSIKAFSSTDIIRINVIYCNSYYTLHYVKKIIDNYFVVIKSILNSSGKELVIQEILDSIIHN